MYQCEYKYYITTDRLAALPHKTLNRSCIANYFCFHSRGCMVYGPGQLVNSAWCTVQPSRHCFSDVCVYTSFTATIQGLFVYMCAVFVHVVVGWLKWSSWSGCSVTCSRGDKWRFRVCNDNVTGDCTGISSQTQTCSNPACPPPRKSNKNAYIIISCSEFHFVGLPFLGLT